MLYSTNPKEDGGWYTAKLDEEKSQLLDEKLESIPTDCQVFIFLYFDSICSCFFDGNNEASCSWRTPGVWVHIDAWIIDDLFHRYSNVKVGISGHIHLLDKVVYNNVTYYCNGAVAGSWWGGCYHQAPPGYALINLYEDGTFNREYVAYGWEKAQLLSQWS